MDKLKNHIYESDEILIGLTVQSLLYSYVHNFPILYKHEYKPRFFEFMDNSVNLRKLGLLEEDIILTSPNGDIKKSYSKEKVYGHLFFLQSLSGLIPFKNEISEFYLDEDNKILKVVSKKQKVYKYKFNKLRIFDTRDLNFLEPSGISSDKIYTLDEFKIKSKSKPKNWYHLIQSKMDFPRNIYLAADKMRIMSQSYMTREELNSPNFSSFFVTKQVAKILKENSIGSTIEWVKRYTEEKDTNEYIKKDYIIINDSTEEEIWKQELTSTSATWSGLFQYKMVQKILAILGPTP